MTVFHETDSARIYVKNDFLWVQLKETNAAGEEYWKDGFEVEVGKGPGDSKIGGQSYDAAVTKTGDLSAVFSVAHYLAEAIAEYSKPGGGGGAP